MGLMASVGEGGGFCSCLAWSYEQWRRSDHLQVPRRFGRQKGKGRQKSANTGQNDLSCRMQNEDLLKTKSRPSSQYELWPGRW